MKSIGGCQSRWRDGMGEQISEGLDSRSGEPQAVTWLAGGSGDLEDFKPRHYWICVLHTLL